MRNWNIEWKGSNLLGKTSFYSTYEELKLKAVRSCENEEVCFYSTYEELKLDKTLRLLIVSVFVFTVPMRNWNKTVGTL